MEANHAVRRVVTVLSGRPFRRLAAFTICVAIVAVACQPDRLTTSTQPAASSLNQAATNRTPPGRPANPNARVITKEAAMTNRMPSRDSVNQCFVTLIDRSTALSRATHTTVTLRAPTASEQAAAGPGRVAASRDTSSTSLFYYIRVDANGKTTQRVNCALPNSEAAYAAAVNTFSLDGYGGPKGARPPEKGATPPRRASGQVNGVDEAEATPESVSADGSAEPFFGYPHFASELESEHAEGRAEVTAVASSSAPTRGSEYDCIFDLYAEWVSCGSFNCQLLEDETYDCGEGCILNPSENSSDEYWYFDFIWETWVVVEWEIQEYDLQCNVHRCDEETLVPSEWEEECEEQEQPSIITVTCTPSTITRGDSVSCIAESSSAPTITLWEFESDSGGVYNSPSASPPYPAQWSGRMIYSGTVSASGTVGGVTATPGGDHVTVEARDWSSSQPTFTVVDIGQGQLPGNPTDEEHLGKIGWAVLLPSGSTGTISAGPNRDMSYMLTMHTEESRVEINRQAFASTHSWILAHRTSGSGNCTRSYLQGTLLGMVEAHEGLAPPFASQSHARIFKDTLSARNVGHLVEAVREPSGGGIVPANIVAAIQADRADAEERGASHSLAIPPTVNCSIIWSY